MKIAEDRRKLVKFVIFSIAVKIVKSAAPFLVSSSRKTANFFNFVVFARSSRKTVRFANFAVFARLSRNIVNFVDFVAEFNPEHVSPCRVFFGKH